MGDKIGVVTGCAGFIGSHLCDALLARGWRVVGIDDLSSGSRDNISHLASNRQFRFVRARVEKPDELEPRLFKGATCVFHLAGKKMVFSVSHPREDLLTNVYGTLNALMAATEGGARRFIVASSSAVYGDAVTVPSPEDSPRVPTNPYGVSKYAAEEYCRLWNRKYGLPAVVLRYSNVYGPRQALNVGVVGVFATQILQGRPLTIYGDGSQVRCLTYVGDVVEATLRAATSPRAPGEAFNVSSNERTTILGLVRLLGRLLKREPELVFEPPRKGEMRATIPDIRKMKRLLGFSPRVSLGEGLKRTIAYYEEKYAM